MSGKPRIVIFTGEGKGKTTAALGMVMRAIGHRLTAVVIQFLKNDASTGELVALNRLEVEVFQGGKGFVPSAESPQFVMHRLAAQATLDHASAIIESDRYDMIVLDEICFAVTKGLLEEQDVLAALQKARAGCVLVLTGRGAMASLSSQADTVSEVRCCKHGYQAGIPAQKGVEF